MIITNKQICDIQLTKKELETLADAERIIAEFSVVFGSNGDLVSAETGECVILNELHRVRAILDFFCDYRVFEKN